MRCHVTVDGRYCERSLECLKKPHISSCPTALFYVGDGRAASCMHIDDSDTRASISSLIYRLCDLGNAWCKKMLADDKGKLNMGQQFMAGVGAGTIEAIVAVTPMETIKTKLIQSNQTLIPGIKAILKESGIGGLYQGMFATVLKQGSNQGLRFMFFNKYKDIMTDNGKSPLSPIGSLLGGMAAGCFSVLGNNPFDVVKTQMQGADAAQYKNTLDCFVKIFKEEGFAGYYKGSIPRMGRVVPGQGIIFMSFESIQDVVEKQFFKPKSL
jgi:solute carrier family 25 (mitochondrial citrate transporter), member 1